MNNHEITFVCEFARQRAAIELDERKTSMIEVRIREVAERLGLPDSGAVIARLRAEPNGPIADRVTDALTTNETSFFRHPESFDALCDHVLPSIIKLKRDQRQLRIWTAACSTGQEPLSIAMVLDSQFPELHDWDVSILATDLCEDVLSKAQSGVYSQIEMNRGLPVQLRLKYFEQNRRQWRVSEQIAQRISYRKFNLIQTAWPVIPTMDIIFLRNVLIYFSADVRRQILGKMRSVMHPAGFMFLGQPESTHHIDDEFERVPFVNAACFQLKQSDRLDAVLSQADRSLARKSMWPMSTRPGVSRRSPDQADDCTESP